MYLAPTEYDFCMILNCIYCIIYCCIYYVCNNLVALLKFVQYVRIKKYLFIYIYLLDLSQDLKKRLANLKLMCYLHNKQDNNVHYLLIVKMLCNCSDSYTHSLYMQDSIIYYNRYK